MTYSAREKALCAEREVRQRQRVYPRFVAEGRMKLDQAEYQIAVMQAIAEDYNRQAATDEPPLF